MCSAFLWSSLHSCIATKYLTEVPAVDWKVLLLHVSTCWDLVMTQMAIRLPQAPVPSAWLWFSTSWLFSLQRWNNLFQQGSLWPTVKNGLKLQYVSFIIFFSLPGYNSCLMFKPILWWGGGELGVLKDFFFFLNKKQCALHAIDLLLINLFVFIDIQEASCWSLAGL